MKAKPLLIATALQLFFIANLTGQEFRFGAIAGIDIVQAIFPDYPRDEKPLDPRLAFNLNGYVGYKGAGFLGISAEPGFIQKGGISNSSTSTNGDAVRLNLNYLQLPTLIDFHITNQIQISLGPEIAYLLSAKAKASGNSLDISDSYESIEWSASLGFHYTINQSYGIGLRFNHGISKTSKLVWTNIQGTAIGESQEFNRYLQLHFRYIIN